MNKHFMTEQLSAKECEHQFIHSVLDKQALNRLTISPYNYRHTIVELCKWNEISAKRKSNKIKSKSERSMQREKRTSTGLIKQKQDQTYDKWTANMSAYMCVI